MKLTYTFCTVKKQTEKKLARVFLALIMVSTPSAAMAQSQSLAEAIRGGWIAQDNSKQDVFVFVVNDSGLSGTHCTVCNNPASLGFVDDGTLTATGIDFTLYHESESGSVVPARVSGLLQGEVLLLEISKPDAAAYTLPLVRSPRDMRALPPGGFAAAAPYIPPGEPLSLRRDNVEGLWLAGAGPGKQHFIFKQHKDGLRGMVCGPCIDASGMAPLENIRIDGTQLHFDIVHENSGMGIVEHGPHRNITVASISRNELHLVTRPSFADASYPLIHMTLLGPVLFHP